MNRETILDQWLFEKFKPKSIKRSPLAGDASFRRYYRIFVEDQNYVVMDAPPPEKSITLFMDVANNLQSMGLNVPRILHASIPNGFLVLSDLGDDLYLKALNEKTADDLYGSAMDALSIMQHCKMEVPTFNRLFLEKQMEIFHEWYLEKHLQMDIKKDNIETRLKPIYEKIFTLIETQPSVFVHRDYHSRNLMVTDLQNPGILDFQDAMRGPITYDLVSLFQDCYITWPREKVESWIINFREACIEKGTLAKAVSSEEFFKWFDWTGLQRHLKNLGVFARLYHRDQKPNYLNDIPRVLNYISETCDRYEELKALKFFFKEIMSKEDNLCVQ